MIGRVSAPSLALYGLLRERVSHVALIAVPQPVKNAALYRKVLDWAGSPPSATGPLAGLHHAQSAWYIQEAHPDAVSGCRAYGCIAAAAVFLSGGYFTDPVVSAQNGVAAYGRVRLPGQPDTEVQVAAQELLGLTPAEGGWLFRADRSIADLRAAWPHFESDTPIPQAALADLDLCGTGGSWQDAARRVLADQAGWEPGDPLTAPGRGRDLVSV